MHAPEPFWQTPEFWVAVSFVIFCGILIYVGAHRKIFDALDQRSARIKAELDDARRLREEAAQLLAEYQRKQRDAEQEAAGIIAGAKAEAERLAAEAHTKMEEFVARRTQMAETKIGAGRSASSGGRAQRRRRSGRRRGRKDSHPDGQGQGGRRSARRRASPTRPRNLTLIDIIRVPPGSTGPRSRQFHKKLCKNESLGSALTR